MKKNRTLIYIILLIFLIGGSTLSYNFLKNKSNTQKNISKENSLQTKATDFIVYNKDMEKVNLSDMFGKPIIINFWASWCTYCDLEMPDFNEAYNNFGDEIEFVMVNATDGNQETKEMADKYIQEGEYDFPIYYDLDLDALINYGINSFPTTIFIDKDGYIVAGREGYLDKETLEKGINLIK